MNNNDDEVKGNNDQSGDHENSQRLRASLVRLGKESSRDLKSEVNQEKPALELQNINTATYVDLNKRRESIDANERANLKDELKLAFNVFDSDRGGYIENDELGQILDLVGLGEEKETLELVAKQLGQHEGKIYQNQFIAALEPFCDYNATEEGKALQLIFDEIRSGSVKNLQLAFDACDADRSGEIDKEELGAVMAALGENLTGKKLDDMYNELDADGDGGVSFDEFIRFMCKRKGKELKGGKKKMANFFDVNVLSGMSTFMQDKNVSPEEAAKAMAAMPALERAGAEWMKNRARKKVIKKGRAASAATETELHVLTKSERQQIKKVERMALFIDIMLGAASASVAGIAEYLATEEWKFDGLYGTDDNYSTSTNEKVYFWLVFGIVSVVATIIEILLIYLVHLKSAISISSIAGLKLFPIDQERAFITAALARAALELPHPRGADLGVNPLEEAAKWKIAVATLVYKAKTGLSTFALRLFFKRVLARTIVKKAQFFVAVPVQMFWNGLIGYKCLRETRTVALGPSVAIEVFNGLYTSRKRALGADINDQLKWTIVRCISVVIIAMEEFHPNVRILLRNAAEQMGIELESAAQVEANIASSISNETHDENEKGKKYIKPVLEPIPKQENSKEASNNEMVKTLQSESSNTAVPPTVLEKQPTAPHDILKRQSVIQAPGNQLQFFKLLADVTIVSPEDALLVLQILSLAIVLNGFAPGKLVALFKRAAAICGCDPNEWPLRWLTFRFLRGEITTQDMKDLFDPEVQARNESQGTLKQRLFHMADRCMDLYAN